MPFVTQLEVDSENGQLFSVRIDDVDRDKDRLALVFAKDGEVGELAFALVDNALGKNLLLLDRDNCTGYAVGDLDKVIRKLKPFGKLDKRDAYLVAEDFSAAELTVNLPPSIGMSLANHKIVKIRISCDLKLDDGETVTLESRTLG